jgi:hypothetical protein
MPHYFRIGRESKAANEKLGDNVAEPIAAPAGIAPAQKPSKPGAISVFISRKEGRLFVRKNFEPMFDVPVTFEHPERPFGTHVFSAFAVKSDSNAVRWTVVSIPGAGAGAASTAADALDRITIWARRPASAPISPR